MNIILKIARTELRNLFYSPIAWFLMIVFLVQCAMTYSNAAGNMVRAMELGGFRLDAMKDLTTGVFTGREGLFGPVMQNLYLYIPLITMGLISREINGGTIKLLYSSPIKVRDIIFGKYIAMMIYSLVLVAIVAIFMVAGLFQIKSADVGMLLSATLGFYLLLCAYSAIGLFMSALTTYQVVAAVSTFVMIGILSYIGKVWQEYDFFRDLTYFLSLTGRTGHMLSGLITSKDVIYFFIIIYIFIGLTIYKLKAERESKAIPVIIGKYVLIIVSALLLGYISSRPAMVAYYDVTANQSNTLTPKSQSIIKDLGTAELEITLYNNLMGNFVYLGLPKMRNEYLQLWEPYLRFKPDIKFKYVSYYDTPYDDVFFERDKEGKTLKQMAEARAKNNEVDLRDFKTPAEIHKIANLKPELNRLVMQLKYKGRTAFVRLYNDTQTFPGEAEISAAFKRLMAAKIPKIAFLNGNKERSIYHMGDRDYNMLTSSITFRNALVNQGFDVDTISLDAKDIPEEVTTLVIADPKTSYSAVSLSKIQKYIAQGRNLLIAGEARKGDILDPVLRPLGVKLLDGMLVHKHKFLAADVILNRPTAFTAGFTKQLSKIYQNSIVTTPGVTAISYNENVGFSIKPLLMNDPKYSWLEKQALLADTAANTFSAADGDIRAAFPTAIALSRKVNSREQRIVVAGDADFMSDGEMNRNMKNANFEFSAALYSWLNYGEFPIDTSRPAGADNRMTITSAAVDIFKIVFIWVLPAFIAIWGSIILIRRKRK